MSGHKISWDLPVKWKICKKEGKNLNSRKDVEQTFIVILFFRFYNAVTQNLSL